MSDLPLTITTRRIADLWLPSALNDGEASFLMDKESSKACAVAGKAAGTSRYPAADRRFHLLNMARCAMRREYHATVEHLRDRGGLLHLVWGGK